MSRKLLATSGLAFVSGWADVVCVVRFSAFAGMQTGNMVMAGRVLVDDEHPPSDFWFFMMLILSGLVGMAAFEFLRVCAPDIRMAWFAAPLAFLIVLSDVLDFVAGSSRWHACLVAVSLGAQNALVAAEFGVSTTMQTGNLSKFGTGIVALLTGKGGRFGSCVTEHAVYPLCVTATVLGSCFGALLRDMTGHVRLQFLPIGILQAVLICVADGSFLPCRHADASASAPIPPSPTGATLLPFSEKRSDSCSHCGPRPVA